MSVLTEEHRNLIKDIKTKSIDELHTLAEGFQKQIQEHQKTDKDKCEQLIDCMQIVIIMIALKKGNYEQYLTTPDDEGEWYVGDTPVQKVKEAQS